MQESRYKLNHLSCQICLKQYDLYYHVPRALKCGHTYCEKCIKGKLVNKKNRLTFTCPTVGCEVDVVIRKNVAEELPKNISIVEMIKSNKFTTLEEEPESIICKQHGNKLEMVCIQCKNIRICSHCAIFGEHKGHEIGSEEQASGEDIQELNEVINIIEDTVKDMLLPQSPNNIEVSAKSKLTSKLQNYVKDNFKVYYSELAKKEAELIEQCGSVMIDEKGGQCLDEILTSFDILKIRGRDLSSHISRPEVDEIITSAKELHHEIEKVVESFNKSVDGFLEAAHKKIKEVNFFHIQMTDNRNIKAILQGQVLSPEKRVTGGRSNSNYVKEHSNKKEVNKEVKEEKEFGNDLKESLIKKIQVKDHIQKKNPDLIENNNKSTIHPTTKIAIKKETNENHKKTETKNSEIKLNANEIALTSESNPKKQIASMIEDLPENSRIIKSSSIKRPQSVKSPDRTKERERSPTDFNADLKYIKPLKELNYEIRPKFQSIIAQIDRQPGEGTLELIGLEITDQMIPYICEHLISKKLKFTMIKLVKNGLTDEGARTLLAYLSTDTFTKVLNLTGNFLTQKTLSSILNFITHNSILKTIYLSHNKISPMQLKKVQSSFDAKFVQIVL